MQKNGGEIARKKTPLNPYFPQKRGVKNWRHNREHKKKHTQQSGDPETSAAEGLI